MAAVVDLDCYTATSVCIAILLRDSHRRHSAAPRTRCTGMSGPHDENESQLIDTWVQMHQNSRYYSGKRPVRMKGPLPPFVRLGHL